MKRRVDNPVFDGPFSSMCEAFVRQRRALGVQYNGQIWTLRRFDNLAKGFDIKDFVITKELALAWTAKSPNETDSYYAARLYIVWHFADFLIQQGCDTQLKRFKIRRNSTHVPYIFTKDEMQGIFVELDKMEYSPCSPIRHKSFPLLFRILYGCGLRISEALNLTVKNVDVQNNMLHVLSGKNNKERLVPMSESLSMRCSSYIKEVHKKHDDSHMLFYSRDGKPYCVSNFEKYFRTLLWNVGIPYCGKGLGPRLHDIRHTFVCHRLNEWARTGFDLMSGLPVLSKYLGHENVAGTQWYLKLTTEAYPEITDKMNQLTGYVFPEIGGDYLEE